MTDRVLVTGASGFIAKHIVLQLVRDGVAVRGSVRSASKADEVRAVLRHHGCDPELFEPIELDLAQEAGWQIAARDCRYVLHTASPFPGRQPRGKFALVPAARDGTLRALKAAREAGCERVVVTSSVAAVFYGYPRDDARVFGEQDVSRIESDAISPYAVSKTVAEEAAWAFSREHGLSLATVNPALVFGPALDSVLGTSAKLVDWMARRRIPFLLDVTFGIADVRDVATAHVRAMRHPEAAGRRFIVSGGERTLRSVAATARAANPGALGFVPLPIPSVLVRAGARVAPQLAMLADEVDRIKSLDTTPLHELLGITPRSPEVAVQDLVESIMQYRRS